MKLQPNQNKLPNDRSLVKWLAQYSVEDWKQFVHQADAREYAYAFTDKDKDSLLQVLSFIHTRPLSKQQFKILKHAFRQVQRLKELEKSKKATTSKGRVRIKLEKDRLKPIMPKGKVLRKTLYLKAMKLLRFERPKSGPKMLMGDSFSVSDERSAKVEGQVEIFFGTNRNVKDSTNPKKYFGSKVDKLRVGTCQINIPKAHKQGRIERPKALFGYTFQKPSDARHIRLKKISELPEDTFYQSMMAKFNNLDDKSALVFVHGYNNSFEEAAWRAGQFAWDLPFAGITALFSWPSAGRSSSYFADVERADQSVNAFKQFLKGLMQQVEISKLHLVAHSMGSRILTTALKELSLDPDFKPKLSMIEQLILAAPDIDQGVFKENLFPHFKALGKRRTLYASEKDKALNLSEKLRGGKPRLGDGGDQLFVIRGIDTIDASNVKSWGNHHSYVFEVNEILTDIFYLFKDSFAPGKRRLLKQQKNNLSYWHFRPF